MLSRIQKFNSEIHGIYLNSAEEQSKEIQKFISDNSVSDVSKVNPVLFFNSFLQLNQKLASVSYETNQKVVSEVMSFYQSQKENIIDTVSLKKKR